MRNYKSKSNKYGLTLNFLEVVFGKKRLSLQKAEYSHDLFVEYKENPNFYIHRYDDGMYVWELCPTDEVLPNSFSEAEVTIEHHAPIFTKIIERAIVTFFINNNYKVSKRRYSSIWEVELKKEDEGSFNALVVRPTIVFSLRNLYSKLESRQVVALTIRKRGKPIFTGSEEEIKTQLTDTRGLTRNRDENFVASRDNLKRYLEATGQMQDYESFLSEMEKPQNEFSYLKQCPASFNKIAPNLHLPNELEVSNFLLVNLPSASFESTVIDKPKYYFYNEGTKRGYYNQVVSELRPYSYDLFRNRKLNILVVSPDEYEGSVDEYMVTLKKKLRDLFHLKDVKFHFTMVRLPETYLSALNKIDVKDYDIAIIILSQRDKDIESSLSPYFLTKAKLLNQRLPTQDLTIEVLRKSDYIIDNNIALNVYSKLGGIAWTIEKSEKNISELIIGIGSTVDDSGERIIGFANVFDYNGAYLVGDCSQLSTLNEYTKNLENYLVETLTQSFEKKGFTERDSVRLIFHLFKEAGKKHELKSIENVLKRFKDYNIQFSLVHLSYGHNFRMFKNWGNDRPDRGTFVQLSSRQALLHLGGRSVVPIQIRLDRRSEYRDLYEITRQVLYFTHLSYRTFIPPSQPVTVKYPNLMAKMVSELKKVPGWDYSILNHLNEKLWFI